MIAALPFSGNAWSLLLLLSSLFLNRREWSSLWGLFGWRFMLWWCAALSSVLSLWFDRIDEAIGESLLCQPLGARPSQLILYPGDDATDIEAHDVIVLDKRSPGLVRENLDEHDLCMFVSDVRTMFAHKMLPQL